MTTARDLLAAHAVGALDAEDTAAVERALDADPSLLHEHGALVEAAARLADATPPATADSLSAVRSRLFDAPEPARAPGLFERFGARFAAIFDVSMSRARELIGLIDDPLAWEPGPGPGSWLIHFEGGPACAAADNGFVKVAPGARFPWHLHHGAEHNLVLAGEGEDQLFGRLYPGDEPGCDGSTEHDFAAVGDEPYIFAVRVFGVDFTVPRPS